MTAVELILYPLHLTRIADTLRGRGASSGNLGASGSGGAGGAGPSGGGGAGTSTGSSSAVQMSSIANVSKAPAKGLPVAASV